MKNDPSKESEVVEREGCTAGFESVTVFGSVSCAREEVVSLGSSLRLGLAANYRPYADMAGPLVRAPEQRLHAYASERPSATLLNLGGVAGLAALAAGSRMQGRVKGGA